MLHGNLRGSTNLSSIRTRQSILSTKEQLYEICVYDKCEISYTNLMFKTDTGFWKLSAMLALLQIYVGQFICRIFFFVVPMHNTYNFWPEHIFV